MNNAMLFSFLESNHNSWLRRASLPSRQAERSERGFLKRILTALVQSETAFAVLPHRVPAGVPIAHNLVAGCPTPSVRCQSQPLDRPGQKLLKSKACEPNPPT